MVHSVVIVDNEILLSKLLWEIIDAFGGYKVLYIAQNGKEMMDKFEHAQNIPDIVLLDINMPIKNGFETAQWLTENHPRVLILALSVDDNEETIIRIIRYGAKGYLLKNIDKAELHKALNYVVEKGYYYSEWLTHMVLSKISNAHAEDSPITVNDRELEFLRLAASERTYKEIGDKMCLSARTVEGYRDQLFERFGLKTRLGLILFALKEKLLKLDEIKLS